MKQTLWTAISILLIIEGIGPMLFPNIWRRMIGAMNKLPNSLLRRYGGSLVVSGLVIYIMLNKYYFF